MYNNNNDNTNTIGTNNDIIVFYTGDLTFRDPFSFNLTPVP